MQTDKFQENLVPNNRERGNTKNDQSRFRAVTPIVFILQPEGIKEKDYNLTDADCVRLWIINHIDDFCIKIKSPNEIWKHKSTDHQGILAERSKNKTWSYLGKPEKDNYQVYFSTIPLKPPIEQICSGLGIPENNALKPESADNIPRPYPNDPLFLRISKRDQPGNFVSELKNISMNNEVTFDNSKNLLRSIPKMPLDIRDKLLNLRNANSNFKRVINILYEESHKEKLPKIWLVKVPSSIINKSMSLGKLSYWQSVMYRDSTEKKLQDYRTLEKQRLITKCIFNDLKILLNEMRGDRLQWFFPEIKPQYSFELRIPYIVYDDRSKLSKNDEMCGIPSPGVLKGPVWLISRSEIDDSAAIPDEKPSSEAKTKSTEPPPDAKLGIEIFKMNNKYTLPVCNPAFPAVDHPVIDEIHSGLMINHYVENLYTPVSEIEFRAYICSIFQKYNFDKQESEFLSNFFYIGEADSPTGSIMLALDGAIKHLQCKIESTMTDCSSYKASPILKLEKNLIVGFGTGCDGYSESPNPKHVYTQIINWWKSLDDSEKSEIKNSYEIEIKGYSSPLGESNRVNVELRNNRAWKIAHSLKLILQNEGKSIRLINEKAKKKEPPDPSQKQDDIPVYFIGEEDKIYPTKNLSFLYAPMGSTLCDLLEEGTEAQKVAESLSKDNDPKDRIGWIIFRRSELRKNNQFVREKGVFNAAAPIAAYRLFIGAHAKIERKYGEQSSSFIRTLLYVVPAFWN